LAKSLASAGFAYDFAPLPSVILAPSGMLYESVDKTPDASPIVDCWNNLVECPQEFVTWIPLTNSRYSDGYVNVYPSVTMTIWPSGGFRRFRTWRGCGAGVINGFVSLLKVPVAFKLGGK